MIATPGYRFAEEAFLYAEAVINKLGLDEEGMQVSHLESLLQNKKIKNGIPHPTSSSHHINDEFFRAAKAP